MRIFLILILMCFTNQSTIAQVHSKNSPLSKIIDSIKTYDLSDGKKINLLEKQLLLSKDEDAIMQATVILADIYRDLELYDISYQLYSKSLNLAKKNKKESFIANYHERIGSIQLRIGDYQNSLDSHKEAYKIFSKTNNRKRMILSSGNIAVLQSVIGSAEEAVVTFEKLIDSKTIDSLTRSKALLSLGNIYLTHLDKPTTAISYYEKALLFLNKRKNKMMQVMLFQNITESYLILNKETLALAYNKRSELILANHKNIELQSILYKNYTEIYKKKGDFKKAFYNIELHHKYIDSLRLKKSKLNIKNLKTRNAISLYKKEIEIQNSKIAILEGNKLISKLKIGILSIFAILLSILIFKMVKRHKKKISRLKSQENKMVSKLKLNRTNTEKLTLNLGVIQDFVDEFSKKIKNIQTTIKNPKDKEQVTKLLRELQSYNRIRNDVKEFSSNIGEINDDYVFNLRYKHPSLTEEELKLCSLIYLKLKNKEIATLLNLSVRSIENKRYRIRKKMNLITTDDLFDVLTNFDLN